MNLIDVMYIVESALKVVFIIMSTINAPNTFIVALITSILGLLRISKVPQFTRQYSERFFLNPHGQNIIYIGLCFMGPTTYIFYAPLVLYFLYGLTQFINQKLQQTFFSTYYMPIVNMIRHNKYYVMQGKCKIQYTLFFFTLIMLPLGFLNRILKVVLLAQFLLLKYRVSNQSRIVAAQINQMIDSKVSYIGFVQKLYRNLVDKIYRFANSASQ